MPLWRPGPKNSQPCIRGTWDEAGVSSPAVGNREVWVLAVLDMDSSNVATQEPGVLESQLLTLAEGADHLTTLNGERALCWPYVRVRSVLARHGRCCL